MQRSLATRAQGKRAAIERNLLCRFDVIGEAPLDLFLRDRRRQQDAALRGGTGQFGDRDIGRARQRRGLIHGGAAAIGKHKAAIAAVARDAIRKGKGQHDAGG